MEKKVVRRRDKRVWYLLGVVFVAIFLFTFLRHTFKNTETEVEAANLAAFDPGYIISDWQMSNYNSMNEAQIQSFLKSKNSCNDTNLGRYTAGDKVDYFSEMSPPRTWHIKNGHFVCMADETFDGGTAAHIIYKAAQDYRINPQVLLVLLEKEQSLVRDTFPHSQQYRSATGYGCPDTAACSSKYYGLKNQIRNAAALFRTVLDGGWTNFPLGNNYVQYNPNAACGGSVVNIRNLATSALYRYTPYQPNAATLGGWSDGCNAYGNMNFYSLFEDWFGGIKDESTVINNNKPVMDLDVAAQAIEKAYITTLGKKVGGIKMNKITGIVFQEYENGFIVGHELTGFYESSGKIRKVWAKSGYESGVLGFPTSPITTNKNTGITFQEYENGAIVGNEKLGYFESRGKIRKVWAKSGYESGVLGFPTSPIYTNKNTGITFQYYEHGLIVGNEKLGYFESRGKIRDTWARTGYESGSLGFPTSPIYTNKRTGIIFQYYEHGSIVGNEKLGYFESRGKIRDTWARTGYESGSLGFPTSPIYVNKNTGITFQYYQYGAIVGNEKLGYFESRGKFREVWANTGYETGLLGFPTSDIRWVGSYLVQDYQHGKIEYDVVTNTAWHLL